MRRVFAVTLLSLMIGCNHDDPKGPDLTSGHISFNFNAFAVKSGNLEDFYAVISDTSGSVIKWSKLPDETTVQMDYPPDSKLAYVTIIRHAKYDDLEVLELYTYTDVPGDDYTYDETGSSIQPDEPKSIYTITFNDFSFFFLKTTYVSDDAAFLDQSRLDNSQTDRWALYDKSQYNAFANFSIFGQDLKSEYRYLYQENITGGDELLIDSAHFTTYPLTPSHDITYPDGTQLESMFGSVIALSAGGRNYPLFQEYLDNNELAFKYPDIANLFPQYETQITGNDQAGSMYSTLAYAPAPTTSFTNLQVSLIGSPSLSTTRIKADVSGQGDLIEAHEDFDSSQGVIGDWNVFTPMNDKIRINLPKFPDDLVSEISLLNNIKDKAFHTLSVIKYNASYADFIGGRLKGLNFLPPLQQSKTFSISPSNGRTTIDSKAVAENLKSLRHNGKIK